MSNLESLYKRADDALIKLNYDFARDLYIQIIDMSPDEAQARRKLYTTLIKKYQERGAPGVTQRLFGIGATFVGSKKPQKRIESCQKALINNPKDAKLRTELAEALLELRHMNGALEEARIAVENDQSNVRANKVWARAQMHLGDINEAKAALSRAIRAKPDDREAEKLLRDLEAASTSQKFAGATDYRSALKNEDQAKQLERKAHMVKTEADVDNLIQEAIQAHEAAPEDPRLIRQVADMFFQQKKDYRGAKEWFEKAVTANPHDSMLKDKVEDCDVRTLQVAIASSKASDPSGVPALEEQLLGFEIQAYERRVADRPTDMALRYELGVRYYKRNDVDQAIQHFQNAVRDPKKKVDASIYLGNCFQTKKLYDLAEKQYQNAQEGSGLMGEKKQIQILYFWARCCEAAGKAEKAIELLSRIVEKDFNYRDAATRLASLKTKV